MFLVRPPSASGGDLKGRRHRGRRGARTYVILNYRRQRNRRALLCLVDVGRTRCLGKISSFLSFASLLATFSRSLGIRSENS